MPQKHNFEKNEKDWTSGMAPYMSFSNIPMSMTRRYATGLNSNAYFSQIALTKTVKKSILLLVWLRPFSSSNNQMVLRLKSWKIIN